MTRRQDLWPLGTLALLLVITAAWWALALWPLPTAAPTWLARARSVCFNTTVTGLPGTSGWILLLGQPLGLFALLWVGWKMPVRAAVARLWISAGGRAVAVATLSVVALGLGAAGVRVANARPLPPVLLGDETPPETYPRLDRALPPMATLADQEGRPLDVARLGGEAAFVTFAFGHCETLCPMVVHAARMVRDRLVTERKVRVFVITLDPWRDTPSRLPSLMDQWELDGDRGDAVFTGPVADVEATLDAWTVPRTRDQNTGDVIHPALVYLVEGDGTVAYASTGAPEQIEALARRLR